MILKIKLHPNSSQEKIREISPENYEVWIKQKPIENKANQELIKILKKHFKCNSTQIIKGLKSKNKVVELK